MLNGTSISDPKPVDFSCDPEHWACGQATESTAKDSISARISSPARAAFAPLLDGLPACVAHAFGNAEDPGALGDHFFILCRDPTTVACWCSQNATLQACLHVATLFTASQIRFRSFAVAKDEGRDRPTGDRRPLNSRERSIGRAHLPHCPRLRPTILGKIGNGADYNSRHQGLFPLERGSSFTRSETGDPRIPRDWLEHLNDETWDVVDTSEIESWVSQDLLETCTSVEPVSESDHCLVGMTAIVMGDVNAVRAEMCSPQTIARCACSA